MIEAQGISPVQLASRSFCPVPAYFKNEPVYPYLKMSFARGLNKFSVSNNEQPKKQAEQRPEHIVLGKLWRIIKSFPDISQVSTKSIQAKLEAEISLEVDKRGKELKEKMMTSMLRIRDLHQLH